MIGHHQDDVDENRIAELGKGSIIHVNGMCRWVTVKGAAVPNSAVPDLHLYRPLLECRKEDFLAF